MTIFILFTMTLSGGYIAYERQVSKYQGMLAHVILAFTSTAWFTSLTITFLLKGSDYFFTPSAIIPIFGIICGNMLNGFVIGLREISSVDNAQLKAIEAKLSLGASRTESVQHLVGASFEKALLPITNAMLSAGIVSLPGVLVGQLAAGEDPVKACFFQMVVLASILFSTTFGLAIVFYLSIPGIFSQYNISPQNPLNPQKH